MAVSERCYVDSKGEEFNSPTAACIAVRHKFVGTDLVLEMGLDDLEDDLIRRNSLFGINVGVGNSYGGQSGEDAFESAESRWETFKIGEWAAGRQIGPRDADVLLALVAAKADLGQEVDIEDLRPRFASDAAESKAGKENPAYALDSKEVAKMPEVKMHIDRIRAERTAERAAKSKAAAQDADTSGLADI